jgi:hypothetical protein
VLVQQIVEGIGELGHAAHALARRARETAHDERIERAWDPCARELGRRPLDRALEHTLHGLAIVGTTEETAAREGFVQDHAERPDVGAAIDGATEQPLGGHVRELALHLAASI